MSTEPTAVVAASPGPSAKRGATLPNQRSAADAGPDNVMSGPDELPAEVMAVFPDAPQGDMRNQLRQLQLRLPRAELTPALALVPRAHLATLLPEQLAGFAAKR